MKEAVNLIVFFACCTPLRAVSIAQRDLVVETPAAGASVLCQSTGTTCGSTSSAAEVTFTNPNYPSAETSGLGRCTITIAPLNGNICQIRLDFRDFALAQPDGEGICSVDLLQVTGGSSSVPKICGDNAGQHMYVDMNPSFGSVFINAYTSAAGSLWSIKIRQIECSSIDRAPPGCLQYFTTTRGNISSFNFNPALTGTFTTRQLVNQAYGICIRPQLGYCSVTYSQATGTSFSLSGDPEAFPPGIPLPGVVGPECSTDYILIPNGFISDTSNVSPPISSADRFCGLYFPGVTSSVPPYNVYVVADSSEIEIFSGDSNNQGFKLTYRLNAC